MFLSVFLNFFMYKVVDILLNFISGSLNVFYIFNFEFLKK